MHPEELFKALSALHSEALQKVKQARSDSTRASWNSTVALLWNSDGSAKEVTEEMLTEVPNRFADLSALKELASHPEEGIVFAGVRILHRLLHGIAWILALVVESGACSECS